MKLRNSNTNKVLSYSNRFLLGLLTALAVVFMAFEYQFEYAHHYQFKSPNVEGGEDIEIPPVTIRKEIKQAPKPKIKTDQIKVVKTLSEPTKKEAEPKEPETKTEDFVFDPTQFGWDDNDDQFIDDIEYKVVEVFPHTKACDGLYGEELKECGMNFIIREIKKNFKTPELIKEIGGRQGAHMSFVINQNGEVENVGVLQSTHPEMSKEAERAILKLPKMIPPSNQGHAVKILLDVPIVVDLRN